MMVSTKTLFSYYNHLVPGTTSGGTAGQPTMMIQKAETFLLLLLIPSFVTLVVGFVVGFIFSRRFHPVGSLVDTSVTEQHNHLNRLIFYFNFDINFK